MSQNNKRKSLREPFVNEFTKDWDSTTEIILTAIKNNVISGDMKITPEEINKYVVKGTA